MSAHIDRCFLVGAALATGFLLAFSPVTLAKTLYVDASTGNDSVTWAENGPSNPWRTIGRATWGSASRDAPNRNEAARAGDTIVIAAGTYSSSLNTGQGRYDVLYNSLNSGTAASPITFVADGTVAIRAPSWGGPAIGARLVDHIVWRGPFLIDEAFIATEPDTGPVVFSATTGSGVDGARIHGAGALWADNHVGVRFDVCNQCFVRNTVIDNFKHSNLTSHNGAAVMLYDSSDVIIEHNEFFDCGSGIYIKGTLSDQPMYRTIVRFNKIYNTLNSGVTLYASYEGRIYQNLFVNTPIVFRLHGDSGVSDHPINNIVANNTVDGGEIGIYYNGISENLVFTNNILTNVGRVHVSESMANPGGASHSRAIYFAYSGAFASFTAASYSFESWQTAFGQDRASPVSQVADPRFVDRARGNYRLQSNSPALTKGVDILDLDRDGSSTDVVPAGAYVTGSEMIGTGAVPPAPPTGLTVN